MFKMISIGPMSIKLFKNIKNSIGVFFRTSNKTEESKLLINKNGIILSDQNISDFDNLTPDGIIDIRSNRPICISTTDNINNIGYFKPGMIIFDNKTDMFYGYTKKNGWKSIMTSGFIPVVNNLEKSRIEPSPGSLIYNVTIGKYQFALKRRWINLNL